MTAPTPPGVEPGGPFTAAIARGDCPLCDGTGKHRAGSMCIHEGELCKPGDPCGLCQGSGRFPPPMPPVLALVEDDPPHAWPELCPGCGRVMSHREAAEQGACNDCNGGAWAP